MACPIKRVLTIQTPMVYKPLVVKDENGVDITNSCLYSWSTDGVCWTGWAQYALYNSAGPMIGGDFYLRILLFAGFSELIVDNIIIDCYSICLYHEDTYNIDWCDNNISIYDNLDCAINLQQQMSDAIICMIGIPIYYFRVMPDKSTADFTFKEYTLHNVESVKYLKLMCQDGAMPSSKPMMTEFDFDWEVDWEVEMGKRQFAKAFGDTAYPKQRDIIYIPMMKRLYEVNAAYDEKSEGFMWHSTTWKLGLVKYQEKSNVDLGNFEVAIDEWADNKMSDWIEVENEEQRRISGTGQSSQKQATQNNLINIFMEDSIRHSVSKNELSSIIDFSLNNRSMVTTRNAYLFKNNDSEVTYQKPMCTDSGSMSFIIQIPKQIDENIESKNILYSDVFSVSWEPSENGIFLSFNDVKVELSKGETYTVLLKWNRQTFTTEVKAAPYIIESHMQGKPEYLIRPEMHQFDFDNMIAKTGLYNNNLAITGKHQLHLSPYPFIITNIKVYNISLTDEVLIKESKKYSTTHEDCIISDVARPIESPHGYSVR